MANQGGSSRRLRYRCAVILMRHSCGAWRRRRKTALRPVGFLRWRRSMTVRRAPRRRKSAASGFRIIRDWVLHFNARGPDGLLNGKSPGQPSKLNDVQRQAIVRIIESGPIPAVHGVVRWRLIALAQWIFEEFRITIAKQTLSRELRAMGYRRLSARPRHHAQAEGAIENFKKVSPRVWRQSREKKRSTAKRLKSGSPTKRALAKRTRSRDGGPSAAPVPARRVTSAPLPPTSSARSAHTRARAPP